MSIKMRVYVTKEVLFTTRFCRTDAAMNKEEAAGFNCAVSYAIRELFPEAFVSAYAIWFNPIWKDGIVNVEHSKAIKTELPREVTNFIRKFDYSDPSIRVRLSPIDFEIKVPDEIVDGIGIKEITTILKDSKTMELV